MKYVDKLRIDLNNISCF